MLSKSKSFLIRPFMALFVLCPLSDSYMYTCVGYIISYGWVVLAVMVIHFFITTGLQTTQGLCQMLTQPQGLEDLVHC